MKIATYNILKGGSQRVHWVKMIDEFNVDLLLVQESYAHYEHLPPLLYLDAGKQSAWELAEPNHWGSAVFSRPGSVKPVWDHLSDHNPVMASFRRTRGQCLVM